MKPKDILDSKDMGTDLRKLIGYVWAEGNQIREFPSNEYNEIVDYFIDKHGTSINPDEIV